MEELLKAAQIEKQASGAEEMDLVNRQTLRTLGAEEVFLFRMVACDNQVDRDFERFTEQTLQDFAPKFVGRPVIMDHKWSATGQTARIYAAEVDENESLHRLILRAYMPRTPQTEGTVSAIESGVLREVSVGCSVQKVVCSICGVDQAQACCAHCPGREYDGKTCHMDLDGAGECYEVSLVPVPAQPGAGIIKGKRYGGQEPPLADGGSPSQEDLQLAEASLELEQKRYGGTKREAETV